MNTSCLIECVWAQAAPNYGGFIEFIYKLLMLHPSGDSVESPCSGLHGRIPSSVAPKRPSMLRYERPPLQSRYNAAMPGSPPSSALEHIPLRALYPLSSRMEGVPVSATTQSCCRL